MLIARAAEMRKYEGELYEQGFQTIAGVDEVGRGPLAGPVMAACVVLPRDFSVLGVDDSKRLTAKRREVLFDAIRAQALAIGIGRVENDVIDEINILNATGRAMTAAVREADEALRKCGRGGIDFILFDAMEIQDISIPQKSLIKGDRKSVSIAAASIIAKVLRDRLMVSCDTRYPGYDFASNKGYGTKRHYEGLRAQGLCPLHRRSFLKNL